jgi:hypothetical protein
MMSVMAGCGFRPLVVQLLEQEVHLAIALDTPQQRRAYFMRVIFRSDFLLLRRIVHYL